MIFAAFWFVLGFLLAIPIVTYITLREAEARREDFTKRQRLAARYR